MAANYDFVQLDVFTRRPLEGNPLAIFIDRAKIALLHSSLPPGMGSSMQKDVAAGRLLELDAIAGPILRGAKKNSLPVTTCQYLNELGR